MKYDLNILNNYIERGLVINQVHPTLPLSIYNYSRTCQYDKLWDDITLNCRGLVLDTKGNVFAKPFPKFFNYEEHKPEDIPNESFEVFEKMDGSLGIIFHYEGEWHMATRGSFTSEQAIKGKKLLDKLSKTALIPGYTYLVEIIYPENRIVVDYGDEEKLVVLGAYNNETGKEVEVDEMVNEGWEIVMKYKTWGEDWETLKKEISKDNEGYVIRFRNGMRMKIKGDEYVRLHRILTNFSTTDIWELLKTKGNMDEFLDRVPDEFDNWVKETVKDLLVRFENIEKDYAEIFSNLKNQNLDRKEFATKALHYRHSSILFSILDGKSYEDAIWKIIKPKWSKPFKKDIDN
jgi:RNA ligase